MKQYFFGLFTKKSILLFEIFHISEHFIYKFIKNRANGAEPFRPPTPMKKMKYFEANRMSIVCHHNLW